MEISFDLPGGKRLSGPGLVTSHVSEGDRRGYRVAVTDLQADSCPQSRSTTASARARAATAVERGIAVTDTVSVALLDGARAPAAVPLPLPFTVDSGEFAVPAPPDNAELPRVDLVDTPESKAWAGSLQPFDQMGAYRLLDQLGRGGMAEVFLAHAVLGDGIEKLVALKMALPEFGPDTEFGALFLNEARVSVTLEHPNLVHVFDAGEFAGRPYLAMEYLQGWSVTQLLNALRRRRQSAPPGLAVAVGIELCKALEYVHEKRDWDGRPLGLVHRDVSGANVLVTGLGEVKLLDFGAAAADSFAESASLVVGKPGYMAPEQVLGAAPSPSWDIFSLGVVLHEMLTLESRFGCVGPPAAPSQRVRGLDSELDRLVRVATSPDPYERPRPRELRLCLQEARARLPLCDLAILGAELLGSRLVAQRAKVERLVGEARRRTRPRRNSRSGLRSLRSVRRRFASTRTWIWMAGHLAVVRLALGASLLALLGPGLWFVRSSRIDAAYRSHLAQADRQIAAGRLAGPGEDTALELLLAAQKLRPDDDGARQRLRTLADAFQDLALLAESRSSPAEAAVHLQGALRADPSRESLRRRLRELEEQVRNPRTR
ncbi:MAG TPA: serine/threonine-protein kinase [Myxococcales bacterium]